MFSSLCQQLEFMKKNGSLAYKVDFYFGLTNIGV